MPQEPRTYTDFASALQLFLEEEFLGEALFDTLAAFYHDKACHALQLMAEIERGVIAAMQPAIIRHGLKLADSEDLRAQGQCEAQTMRAMSWADFLDHVDEDYPAFLDEFEQLFRLAPEADKADAQLLLDHEGALMDFTAAERKRDTNSIEILTTFLRRLTEASQR